MSLMVMLLRHAMKTLHSIGNDLYVSFIPEITGGLFQFDGYNKDEQLTSVFHFQAKGTFQGKDTGCITEE